MDEACANVIEHAYQHDSSKEVTVRAIVDDEALRFRWSIPASASIRCR